MEFARPLLPARLLQRYKRFLADAVLEADAPGHRAGETVTAHLANPGSMMGLKAPGLRVWLEPNDDPKRKLKFTVRMVELPQGGPEAGGDETGTAPPDGPPDAPPDAPPAGPPGSGVLVGVDTGVPNRLIAEALAAGRVPGLEGYAGFRPEVRYRTGSRVDFLGTAPGLPDAYVEVKNVHLVRRAGLAEFPDSVTARGAKHLGDLAAMVAEGHRAVMLYCIQRGDVAGLAMAADLDPGYAKAFSTARAAGVEAIALRCHLSLNTDPDDAPARPAGGRIGAIWVDRPLPIAEN